MSLSQEERGELFRNGNVEEVKRFLKDNPTWDVNEVLNGNGWTALHLASHYGHHEIISLLLVYTEINVNQRTNHGETPFFLACHDEEIETAKVLLRDPQVDINPPNNLGRTPLWIACCYGNAAVIKWMIASGRDLFLDEKGQDWDNSEYYTALDIAETWFKTEVVSLLEGFVKNQTQTRHEVRVELGVVDALAAELFATTVFLCDDFLRIRKPDSNSKAGRFLRIVSRLPMELQMVLCHRVYGSDKDNIPSKDSEPAFRHLASLYQK